jgi:ABC-2 type transport system permease protein
MTVSEGAVYDLGYEPFEGERRGRKGAWTAVWMDGLRRILGIRRKARRKIMPWLLVAMALVPPILGVGVAFILPGSASGGVDLASQNSEFFALGGTITMLFTALAAPELLIPDRKDGVLSMLSSRPLTSTDYVSARFASLLTVVGAFLLLPQLVLFIGQAGTDPDGLVRGIVNAADTLPKILVVSAIYVIAYVPLGFAVSSLSDRKAIAASVYLAGILALTAFAEAIVRNAVFAGGRWLALISPINTADTANAWVFGKSTSGSLLDAAGIDPVIGVLALVVGAAAATALSLQRYRGLM